jgi:hypothetical protein
MTIENCSAQVYFDTNDEELKQLQARTGQVRIRTGGGSSQTGSSDSHTSFGRNTGGGTSTNSSQSWSDQRVPLIDGSVFHGLRSGEALVLANLYGRNIADVCVLPRLWMDLDAYLAGNPEHKQLVDFRMPITASGHDMLPWTPCKDVDPGGRTWAALARVHGNNLIDLVGGSADA